MRYNKISIPNEITQEKGIEPINVQRLYNVIAFIGKNGSGKTRILDLIEKNPCFVDTEFKDIPNDLKTHFHKLERLKEIEELKRLLKINRNDINIHNKISVLQQQIQNNENINTILANINVQITNKYIRRIKQDEISSLQKILSENAEQKFFEELMENTEKKSNYNEFSSINKGAFKYLVNLPHKLVADEIDCMGDTNKLHSRVSYKRFVSLKKYISIFLNKELEWDRKNTEGKFLDTPEGGYNQTYQGFLKLDNRVFNYDEFSDGEKILFSYAILFFLIEQNQKLNIRESILIIDEPELHLHADSEIDLIGKLREIISEKGQLIIATHSINILSSLNYEELYVVKNGKIYHPSQESFALSLLELISIEERVNKLSDLLYSVDNWLFINFIAQCFSEPEAIKTANENDSQIKSIRNTIKSKINNQHEIFLDFGAGKGRVLEGLLCDEGIFPKLKYYALEPKTEYHSELRKLGILNIYTDYNELSDNTLDFVLLSNVLHEMPIISWENTINKVIDSLKEDGYLMIVEAKILSKGEKINDTGFIVLDEESIQVLFELPCILESFFVEGFREKITSVIIEKKIIKKINTNSIIKALLKVKENSIEHAKELILKKDKNVSNYTDGRKMAFYAMQLMNVQLCLNKMKENTLTE